MLDNQRTDSNNHAESILCGLRYAHGSTRGEWVIGCGCGCVGKIRKFNAKNAGGYRVDTVIIRYGGWRGGRGSRGTVLLYNDSVITR